MVQITELENMAVEHLTNLTARLSIGKALQIPLIVSMFQKEIRLRLSRSVELHDSLDELTHKLTRGYKLGTNDLAVMDLGASELKTMVHTHKDIRKLRKEIDTLDIECKTLDGIVSELKSISFYHSNIIKAKMGIIKD